MAALIPADPNQCQCEITAEHGPFRLGPRSRPKRCEKAPVFIAKEVVPGKDGMCGEMSLCKACATEMLRDDDLASRVQLTPIVRDNLT